MQLLYILEQLRTPAVTKALSALTYFGGVYGFMVLSIIVFWCIDKRCGYFMLSLGFLGTVINQFLKIIFHDPHMGQRKLYAPGNPLFGIGQCSVQIKQQVRVFHLLSFTHTR